VNSVRRIEAVILVASAAAVALVTFAGVLPALRPAVVVWFVLVCPGAAVVSVFQPRDPWLRLSLTFAVSIVLATLVPGILLYAGAWSPNTALALLIELTLVATAISLAFPPAGIVENRTERKERLAGEGAARRRTETE
jgi:uncharacterized membrane protein